MCVQGFDKGIQSQGKTKTRFRKAPKSENVYIKLLVKVSYTYTFNIRFPLCSAPTPPIAPSVICFIITT